MSVQTESAPTSETTPDVDYPIYDADQHYYEPADCISRHLDPKYRGIVRWADIDGRKTVLINGRQLTVVPNPTYDPVAAPGSLETYFRSENFEGKELRDMVTMQSIQPEYRDRAERVKRLDEQGVEQTWLLPSFGLGIEEMLQEDPESTAAIFTAYNRWLDEDWGYARDNRIIAPPMITLIDVASAEAEVDRVLALGARMVILKAGPVANPYGQPPSPADPRFDGVWARLAEAGAVVVIHAGDAGYTKFLSDWGESTRYTGLKSSPLTEVLSLGVERPIFDMMAAMVCHGLFDRHPALKVATVELGSAWLPDLHRRLKAAYGKTPQLFKRDPIESLREHVWIAPFYEDKISTLREVQGADRILLGSDWPHPEGLPTPRSAVADYECLGAEDMRKALHENQKALTGTR
ncbi:MAG: amidohydrolase [Tetrasphaera sp.]|jgi:predicted TIM-barrel fold metal-dependent hydrolase|nr:amidohydrolase [Tetrasphaera sp.]